MRLPVGAGVRLLLLLLAARPARCHDAEVQLYIEALKQRVLEELGMLESQPNVTRHQLPASVARAARHQRHTRWKPPPPLHAHTLKLWTLPAQSPVVEADGELRGTRLGADALVFQLPQEVTIRSMESAQLLLYTRQPYRRIAMPSYINIYQLVPYGSNYRLQEVTTRTLRAQPVQDDMVSVDVTELVRHWLKHPAHNLGMVVRATDLSGNLDTGQYITTSEHGQRSPVLQTALRKHAQRSRRSAEGSRLCSDPHADPRCCLYPLTVDFHSFGWDWIIAPSSYEANFCRGTCPSLYLQKYPHTHIAQQAGGTSGPCCSARRLDSLTMLYWNNEQEIQLATLPGMRVLSCGCH